MLKKCPTCLCSKDISKFNWRIKGKKLATYCKDCSREKIRIHYSKNKKYYLEKARKRNVEARKHILEYIERYLKTHSCVDCGEKDLVVLEFDHRSREEKFDDINKIIRRRLSIKRLSEEISKCDVRCANCHRRKTEKENNSWKYKMRQ